MPSETEAREVSCARKAARLSQDVLSSFEADASVTSAVLLAKAKCRD